MNDLIMIAGLLVLASVAVGLLRVLTGPGVADRVMAAQLLGTGGIAVLLLFAAATDTPGLTDTALTLALLAAFATVALVRGAPGGDEDPPA